MKSTISFHLPEQLNAIMPPERRGVRRDRVKMLVLDRQGGQVEHTIFYNLEAYLKAGDVLILNNSRTIPAQLMGTYLEGEKKQEVTVRLAHRLSEDVWQALVLGKTDWNRGDQITFSPQLSAKVEEYHPEKPLVTIKFSVCCNALFNQFYTIGQPIRYEYIETPWDLDYYQTVFASVPGSVEMPSAGRAFSWEMILALKKQGVQIGFLQLHTGLSYFEDDKWSHHPEDNIEEFVIPSETATIIKNAKEQGGKVIAVGTTVVRALEAMYLLHKKIEGMHHWTNLYIDSSYPLNIVDGLITGMHEPEASHLDMLSAFISPDLLGKAYENAIAEHYLWHEFGDMNLIL